MISQKMEDDFDEIMSQCASAESVAAFNRMYSKVHALADALDLTDDALRSATLNGRSQRDHDILSRNLALLDGRTPKQTVRGGV